MVRKLRFKKKDFLKEGDFQRKLSEKVEENLIRDLVKKYKG